MIVACRLRTVRGDRSLRAIAETAGVHEAELSRIERGMLLPRDEWLSGLEQAYGVPRNEFYPAAFTGPDGTVLVAIQPDEGG